MSALPNDFLHDATRLTEEATRPFPASRKIHVEGSRPDIRVPMREISLTPTRTKDGIEINIPKLTEMAYEQVELAGVPFSTFIANKTADGRPGNYSLVLRGYVRTWLMQVANQMKQPAVG